MLTFDSTYCSRRSPPPRRSSRRCSRCSAAAAPAACPSPRCCAPASAIRLPILPGTIDVDSGFWARLARAIMRRPAAFLGRRHAPSSSPPPCPRPSSRSRPARSPRCPATPRRRRGWRCCAPTPARARSHPRRSSSTRAHRGARALGRCTPQSNGSPA